MVCQHCENVIETRIDIANEYDISQTAVDISIGFFYDQWSKYMYADPHCICYISIIVLIIMIMIRILNFMSMYEIYSLLLFTRTGDIISLENWSYRPWRTPNLEFFL